MTSVRLASDAETGRMKGYAYVDFRREEDALKVSSVNGGE